MKRFLTILSLTLICGAVSAQIVPNPNIPNDPVDYSRLVLPTNEPALPTFFTVDFELSDTHTQLMAFLGEEDRQKMTSMDKVTLRGKLVHTWNITPEFVEECIQKALAKSGIGSRARLAQIYRDTPVFKDFTYTNRQFASDMFGFVSSVVGVAVPAVVDLAPIVTMTYGATTGSVGLLMSNLGTDPKDIDTLGTALGIAGIASSAFEGAMPGAVTSTVGNGLTAAQMFLVMKQQHDRDVQKYENRAYIVNMARVDYFYHLVNMYLCYDMPAFDRVWVLAFPQSEITIPYNFRGVTCKVNWRFNMGAIQLRGLNPKPGDVPEYDFEGEYFGYFNAAASYDLSEYDKKWLGDVKFLELIGAKGDNASPFVNSAAHTKGIVDADPLRSEVNMYKSLPDYIVSSVINEPTNMKVEYASPIHLRIEAPISRKDAVFERHPDYFWDYYEDTNTETAVNKSDVMRAMGVTVGGREADVKPHFEIYKGYTAMSKNGASGKIRRSEYVVKDNYCFRDDSDGREPVTNTFPILDVLKAEGVSVTVPDGMLHVIWSAEIMPPPRNARWATEQDWKKLFDKYKVKPVW